MVITHIYTDGACDNVLSKRGGCGAVMVANGLISHQLSWSYPNTTSSRMELMGFIKAWEFIYEHQPARSTRLMFLSDSSYFTKGFAALERWQDNQWHTNAGYQVKNLDLWREIYDLKKANEMFVSWIKGHSNCRYNDLADRLAKQAMNKL